MVKKQKKKTRKEQSSFVSRKPKKISVTLKKKARGKDDDKDKAVELAIKISQTQTDVKSYLEKFKADVARKIKQYREYAQESQKRKKL